MARIEREDVRRSQLIEATIDTMAEVGFAATTLALIGQRAGISTGLVGHYFRDKDGLLEATLRHLTARLARGAASLLSSADAPRARLQAIIDSYLAADQFEHEVGAFTHRIDNARTAFGPIMAKHRRLA